MVQAEGKLFWNNLYSDTEERWMELCAYIIVDEVYKCWFFNVFEFRWNSPKFRFRLKQLPWFLRELTTSMTSQVRDLLIFLQTHFSSHSHLSSVYFPRIFDQTSALSNGTASPSQQASVSCSVTVTDSVTYISAVEIIFTKCGRSQQYAATINSPSIVYDFRVP